MSIDSYSTYRGGGGGGVGLGRLQFGPGGGRRLVVYKLRRGRGIFELQEFFSLSNSLYEFF